MTCSGERKEESSDEVISVSYPLRSDRARAEADSTDPFKDCIIVIQRIDFIENAVERGSTSIQLADSIIEGNH